MKVSLYLNLVYGLAVHESLNSSMVINSIQPVYGRSYHVAQNFCGSLFLQIGNFFCFAGSNLCDFRTDWFFLQGINFAIFRKYPEPSIDNIFIFIEYVPKK